MTGTRLTHFDSDVAIAYDTRFAKLDAMKQCLHLLTRVAFADLPESARILCVGIGTGAELLFLAEAFPTWQFVVTDPSKPMLDVCRGRASAAGIAHRCTFHDGYLDTLPESEPFDAATCLLVSQFMLNVDQRRGLFRQIAERLRSGGRFVSADLSADMSASAFPPLFELWMRAWRYAGVPAEQIEKMSEAYGRDVAVLPADDVAALIRSSGFDEPTAIFQALLVRAWHAKRAW